MVCSEQVPFSGADYYNGNLLPFPADQTSAMLDSQFWYGDTILAANGFSQVPMNAIHNATDVTQSDALAGFNHIPLSTDPFIDRLEVQNYDISAQRSSLPFYGTQESSRHGGLDNFVLNQWMPKEEPISFMDMEWQQVESPAFPVQAANVNDTHEFLSNVKVEADTSDVAPVTLKSVSRTNRERSKEAETRRRLIISQRVQDLHDLLPATFKDKRGNQESIVNDVIGHIKYLQLQLKELSRSRLGGDSSSGPLKFDEGYGHYQPHEQMFGESLDKILGSLLEENPVAAHNLFESKGLCMVPMASTDALSCNIK
ncbi:uncharacterized protein LOC110694971 [Chenopodium quinoa]|uniref:BHLH domain-containing protein n=1 Tax=Chenopodium quinoa TaxID=63459 RepID=A0A803MX71_CHEQI|nr:uncharacterized protein LOC110694971 [Chenopodium quinoa]XP_021727849.1 uncharacterized protein LOC110694971 [Chenopodium quinoa]